MTLGRPFTLTPKEIARARELREQGYSLQAIGAELGVAHTTVSRALLLPSPKPEVEVVFPSKRK